MSKESLLKVKNRSRNELELIGDNRGRLATSYEMRDATATGRATLALAVETAVISGVAGTFLDVVHISVANSSTVAQSIDIRLGTASNVQDTIVVPATNTVAKNYFMPLMMSEAAAAVTAQNSTSGEISDSSITVSIIASKNT